MKKLLTAIHAGILGILISSFALGAGFFEQGNAPTGGYPSAPTFTHVGTGSVTVTDNIAGTGTTDLKNFRNGTFAGTLTVGTLSAPAVDNLTYGSYLSSQKPRDVITQGPRIDVRSMGVVGDNTADDTIAMKLVAAAVPVEGATVYIPDNLNVLIDSDTVTFSNKVVLTGRGTITIGSGVGNKPGIILAGDHSRIEHLTIVGDASSFTNASSASEFRSAVKVTGDYTWADGIKVWNSIFGVTFSTTNGGGVINSFFRNDIIGKETVGTYPNQNNCQAIYATGDTYNLTVSGNYIYGYGEAMFSGQRCRGFSVTKNITERQGDNGLYLSGIMFNISGNIAIDVLQSGIKGFFNGVSIVHNRAFTTGTDNSYAGVFVQALNNYAGQSIDGNGNNSYDIDVSHNIVSGKFTSAGIVVVQNPVDNSGVENVTVESNSVRGADNTATATSGMVGIQVQFSSANRYMWGSSVSSNRVTGCFRAFTIAAPSTGFMRFLTIADNRAWGCIGNGMTINYVQRSRIHGNILYDPIGTTVTPIGFSLTGVSDSDFTENKLGNTSASGKMANMFKEVSGCSRNRYINNTIEQSTADYTLHYVLNNNTGFISVTSTRIRTLTGSTSFMPGEAKVYILDATGLGSVNYNPKGQFTIGYKIEVLNTSTGSNNIVIDSSGLNAKIQQNQRGTFIYDGSNWRKYYIGS